MEQLQTARKPRGVQRRRPFAPTACGTFGPALAATRCAPHCVVVLASFRSLNPSPGERSSPELTALRAVNAPFSPARFHVPDWAGLKGSRTSGLSCCSQLSLFHSCGLPFVRLSCCLWLFQTQRSVILLHSPHSHQTIPETTRPLESRHKIRSSNLLIRRSLEKGFCEGPEEKVCSATSGCCC